MEEKAGHYKEYDTYFNLTESNIRKIYSIFEEYSKKIPDETEIIITMIRKDNSYFETKDLEKILEDENTLEKSIQELTIEILEKNLIKSKKENTKALICFNSLENKSIYFMTSYKSRDWCFLLADELDSQIKRIIDHNKLSVFFSRYVDLIAGLILFFSSSGYLYYQKKPSMDIDEVLLQSLEDKINFLVKQSIELNDVSVLFPLFIVIAIIVLIELKLFSKFFNISNMSVFYWGDMIGIYDKYMSKKTKIKWSVIVAFVISFMASLLTVYIL